MDIDYSQLQTYVSCPMKYYNRYVKKLKKREYDITSMDLDFGSAIHKALEIFYTEGMDTKAMEKGTRKFVELYNDLEGEDVKTVLHGVELLKLYKNYHDHNFKEWKILSAEEVDKVPLGIGGNIMWLSKKDLVIDWRDNIYVVDFKTSTTKYRANFFSYFEPNMQVSGNTYSCFKKYGGCSGFIPLALFMGFRKRASKYGPAGFHCDFEYTIINKTKEQIADFEANAINWVASLEASKKIGSFPKNENNCHNFRGCGFKELCLACGDEQIIEALYEENDPYEYLKEEK